MGFGLVLSGVYWVWTFGRFVAGVGLWIENEKEVEMSFLGWCFLASLGVRVVCGYCNVVLLVCYLLGFSIFGLIPFIYCLPAHCCFLTLFTGFRTWLWG